MTPSDLYQAGKLSEAIAALLEEVRRNPSDTSRRGLLATLLCFAGELERSDKQLDTLGHQEPQLIPGISMIRQLIRAETARQDFYNAGRLPEFAGEVSTVLRLHLDASIAIREGNTKEAAELLSQAEQQRPRVKGVCDGETFDDMRDLDDLTASFFEVLTSNGKYFWIPIETVEMIEFKSPERPQDILWRRATMTVHDGPDGEIFLPSTYAGTASSEDDQLRLGRATDWLEDDKSPTRGIGLRMFLIGDSDKSILQLKEIEFDRP